jgi:hypothetical protein
MLPVYEFHTSRRLGLVDRFSHTNLAHRLDSLSMMSMQSMLGYRSGSTWIIDIIGIVGVYGTSMQICRSGLRALKWHGVGERGSEFGADFSSLVSPRTENCYSKTSGNIANYWTIFGNRNNEVLLYSILRYFLQLRKIVAAMKIEIPHLPAELIIDAWVSMMLRACCWDACHFFVPGERVPTAYYGSQLPVYIG